MQDYLDANPHQLDNRTLFQSNLLHIAARNGQTAIVEELLRRGSDLDALDYVRIIHNLPVFLKSSQASIVCC